MKIQIELEFDENDLGLKWMNIDSLKLLLYSKESTRKELLRINKFQEDKEIEDKSIEFLQCPYCGAKLERVFKKDKSLIPTSCNKCNHHNLVPNMKKFIFII